MEKEEEDRRREAAIASSPCLQPNFKPKGVTEQQLSKFRELHRRRIQLKSKSKSKTKSKDDANKPKGNDLSRSQKCGAEGLKINDEEPSLWSCEVFHNGNEEIKDNVPAPSPPKKQKLHWGLDTKERWERKSNM